MKTYRTVIVFNNGSIQQGENQTAENKSECIQKAIASVETYRSCEEILSITVIEQE